jgi:membrane-bound serine protease (ClpP class)
VPTTQIRQPSNEAPDAPKAPGRARACACRAAGALALLAALAGAGAAPASDAVTHMRLAGPIDEGTLAFLERTVRAAEEQGGGRLVIELDTPGGPVEVMWTLSKRIDAALQRGVRVIAWVNASALSAGALVALSCEDVYMRRRATIGSAQPIVAVPGMGAAPVPEPLEEKVQSVLRARFRAVAGWRGRPEALAEAMVDPEVEVRKV